MPATSGVKVSEGVLDEFIAALYVILRANPLFGSLGSPAVPTLVSVTVVTLGVTLRTVTGVVNVLMLKSSVPL